MPTPTPTLIARLLPCPFCGAQPYVADPTNFPGDYEHPWDHKGCIFDGYHITAWTAWNTRALAPAPAGDGGVEHTDRFNRTVTTYPAEAGDGWNEAVEAAAKLCERRAEGHIGGLSGLHKDAYAREGKWCAAAIRTLKRPAAAQPRDPWLTEDPT